MPTGRHERMNRRLVPGGELHPEREVRARELEPGPPGRHFGRPRSRSSFIFVGQETA
jgi:hypothetical protein